MQANANKGRRAGTANQTRQQNQRGIFRISEFNKLKTHRNISFMKTETINGARIACYDNDGKSADRFTVIYLDEPERAANTFAAVGMNAEPFHPQGIGQHGSAMPGRHLGRRIALADLPADCQKLVQQDTKPLPL
jgi:hypothetical protein